MTRRLVDDDEGAAYIGVSKTHFRNLVGSGVIKRVQVPSADGDGRAIRRLLVDRNDLDELIERWKTGASNG